MEQIRTAIDRLTVVVAVAFKRLTERLNAHERAIQNIADAVQVGDTRDRVETLEGWRKRFSQRFGDLSKHVSKISKRVAALEARSAASGAHLDQTAIERLRREMEADRAVQKRIAEEVFGKNPTDNGHTGLRWLFTTLTNAVHNRYQRFNEDLTKVEARVAALETEVNGEIPPFSLSERIRECEREIGQLKGDQRAPVGYRNAWEQLEARVLDIEKGGKLTEIAQNAAADETSSMQGEIDDIRRQVVAAVKQVGINKDLIGPTDAPCIGPSGAATILGRLDALEKFNTAREARLLTVERAIAELKDSRTALREADSTAAQSLAQHSLALSSMRDAVYRADGRSIAHELSGRVQTLEADVRGIKQATEGGF